MSDQQPHQVGARRRRRELREARERERAAASERPAIPEEPDEEPATQIDEVMEAASQPKGRIEHDADGTPLLITPSSYGRGYQTVTPMDSRVNRSALKQRRIKRRRRNLTLAVALGAFALMLTVLVISLRALFGGLFTEAEDYDAVAGDELVFTVNQGEGWETVGNRLVDQEIIASSDAFREAFTDLEASGELGELHPGDYPLNEEMPASEALQALAPEQGARHYIVLNAGTRIDSAFSELSSATGIDEGEFRAAAEDPTAFGLPEEASTLEGYLAPGTYYFDVDTEPEEILQTLVDATFERLEEAGVTDEEEQWRTIIIASLITAEANHNQPDDYPLIASAIENRLDPDNPETDGLLQIDAAVHYGAGSEGDLQAAAEERQDESNPYNTYIHEGLPPGPIGAPVSGTIDAAANPADTNYYYWVTVNIETGETEFNETYAEHVEDVQQFQQWCEDNPGVCSPAEAEAVENAEE